MKHFSGLRAWLALALLAFVALSAASAQTPAVLRATLDNGLRVVIVPNRLAPVVSTSLNYLAGSDQAPAGFPGTAHALEHMMFRGGPGLSAAQLSRLSNLVGGRYNANTRESLTQYYYTVPAADLEIALQIEATRMRAIDCTEADWVKERGAIEQEVASHLSSPDAMMHYKVNAALFAGTPYAEQTVGTRDSFDRTPAAMLKAFHETWYAPNNAILVVSGDVDPQKAMASVTRIFAAIPAKSLPVRPAMVFKPVQAQTLAMETDKPYAMVYLALRAPGLKAKDLPALEVLADVMQSQRSDLYELKVQGKALGTFYSYDPMGEAGSILIGAAIPAGGDVASRAKQMEVELRALLVRVAEKGVSADLVAAAKRQEAREQAQLMTSISGQASVWADALALYGLSSPQEDLERIDKVSVADVNRAAKTYFIPSQAVVAVLTPGQPGQPAAAVRDGGETVALAETGAVTLPDWAAKALATLEIPHPSLRPVVSTLKNGLTLIVQPADAGDTVAIRGYVRNRPSLQEPAGKEGVAMMTQALMGFGTTSLDRVAFQTALDDVGAQVEAGTNFSAQALAKDFDRASALLADNLLHPALPEAGLAALGPQYAQYIANRRHSPDYRAARALDEALLPAADPDLREPTPESLAGLTRADLLAYHQAVFRPDMTAIVVIGAVTPEAARTIVEKHFGAWAARGPQPAVVPAPVPDNRSKAVAVADASRVQDRVWLAQSMTLTRTSADYPALALGNVVLGGGGFGSKLFDDLRVRRGLVYFVGSDLNAGRSRGRFTVSFASDPGNATKAADLIRQAVRAMQATPVSDEELQNAKAMVLRQIPLGEDSTASVADGYLRRFDYGLPYDEPVRLAEKLVAATPVTVQAAFKRWLRPGDLVCISQGPAAK